ncbi:hypothetical protein EYF80_052266 [Liparis tanakae]|uniref:Uncharacterized protein n=1 Tax=Liparis tanakae TaxID=230148 RepID=A0A4Z2F8S8_9TELE|nr:hypothetical protein EYF80_052266 [Liparis tanakae]
MAGSHGEQDSKPDFKFNFNGELELVGAPTGQGTGAGAGTPGAEVGLGANRARGARTGLDCSTEAAAEYGVDCSTEVTAGTGVDCSTESGSGNPYGLRPTLVHVHRKGSKRLPHVPDKTVAISWPGESFAEETGGR